MKLRDRIICFWLHFFDKKLNFQSRYIGALSRFKRDMLCINLALVLMVAPLAYFGGIFGTIVSLFIATIVWFRMIFIELAIKYKVWDDYLGDVEAQRYKLTRSRMFWDVKHIIWAAPILVIIIAVCLVIEVIVKFH